MRLLSIFSVLATLIFISGCGTDGKDKLMQALEGLDGGSAGCPAVSREADERGCRIAIRSPNNCQIITHFPIEFGWEGQGCATPYTIYLAGEAIPQAESNGNWAWQRVNTTPINAQVWAEPIYRDFIRKVHSSNGWYQWVVCNAYDNGCTRSAAFYISPGFL
jgi:hypothetical protein